MMVLFVSKYIYDTISYTGKRSCCSSPTNEISYSLARHIFSLLYPWRISPLYHVRSVVPCSCSLGNLLLLYVRRLQHHRSSRRRFSCMNLGGRGIGQPTMMSSSHVEQQG
jgi:hypothetical protein